MAKFGVNGGVLWLGFDGGEPASLSPALARSLRVSWNLVESDF